MLKKKYINIGACEFHKTGWINLDKTCPHYSSWQSPIDIDHDLMSYKRFPIENNTLDIAYTSHTIEHLGDENVYYLFEEVYRILKKGGTFRITCPDIDRLYTAYTNKNLEYISGWKNHHPKYIRMGIGQQLIYIFAGWLSPWSSVTHADGIQIKKYEEREIKEIFDTKNKVEALTHFTTETQKYATHLQAHHPGDHISWWDYNKLKTILKKIGFQNVNSQQYNKSDVAELGGFDGLNTGNIQKLNYTLFMECIK